MIEKGGDAHQFLEDVEERASLGRLAPLPFWAIEVGLYRDGVDQEYFVLSQEPVELVAHGTEGGGLNLDQHVGSTDVDDKALEWDFEFVTGLGVVLL